MSEPREVLTEEVVVESPELPALPDGGLSANMPAWLRRAPAFAAAPPEPIESLDEQVSLTMGLDLPEWLNDLSARVDRERVEPGDKPPVIEPLHTDEPDTEIPPPVNVITDHQPVQAPEMAPTPGPERVSMPSPILEAPPEPVIEPPYGRIALMVLVIAGALAFIALWAMLA